MPPPSSMFGCHGRTFWRQVLVGIGLLAAGTPGLGQIGGISNSKLFIPAANILEPGAFEFEPAYQLQGDMRGFGFRFSAGFGQLEAGVSLDNAVDSQSAGLKYGLIPGRLSLTAGVEYDTTFHQYAAGIIYSQPFSEQLTTDFFAAATSEGDWAVMAGVGYFLTEPFQPIVELAIDQDGPSVSTGFTYAPNESVLVVFGVQQVIGNGDKPLLSVAFTFSM